MDPIQFDGYTIRRATETDVRGFLDLHASVFGTWPDSLSREIFEWKYEDNPYFDELPVIVAESGGEIVGAKGHFGLNMALGGTTILGIQTADLMVHPAHRRNGILTKMVELDTAIYDTGRQLFFGFPARTATAGYLDAGRRKVENPLFVRLLSPTELTDVVPFNPILRTIGTKGYKSYLRLVDGVSQSGKEYDVEVENDHPIELLCTLYERRVPPGIHAERTAEFYEWRLSDPLHDMRTYIARCRGDPVAAMVVSESDDHVHIREISPSNTSQQPVRALLETIISDFSDRDFLTSWCPQSLDEMAFVKAGFIRSNVIPRFPYATDMVVRSIGERWEIEGHRIDEPSSWDIQLLERDY